MCQKVGEDVVKPMGRQVRFDRFRFDMETGRLWAGEQEVRLTPKAAAVMGMLVAHGGEPVAKEQLFASVWPDTAVSDDALTTCIAELRRALEDDARQARFIETRHRRGYRFAAPMAPVGDATVPPAPRTAAAPAASERDIATIAVLPFADMSPARDHEYLCEGLAEELINALTQVEGLRVAARAASFRFRDIGSDIRTVGRQLGVTALLEGSVRKADNRLRVNVQLIEVATGYHHWSRRFDRAFEDIFAIQDEIAGSVVLSLRGGVLSPREQESIRRPSAKTEAYEYYLRGRQSLPRQTREGHQNSIRMFERAIGIDDTYAPAHAGLAMAHAALHEWFGAEEADRAAAEQASERALKLAPSLAEAHVARGCALSLSRRYAEAAQAFDAAVVLNKNLFEAYYYYGRTSFAAGEIARSADLFRKAAAARREDFQSALLAAQSLRMLGRRDEANEVGLEGVDRAERALEINPTDTRALSLTSGLLNDLGQTERALEWSERALAIDPDDMSALINGACLRAVLGHKERALELLEKALTRRWAKRDWIENDPDYDSLRDHPRFQRLMAGLK
jgi:TolB-like protein/tetratricopeptide (TPR) repeat protein